MPETDMPKHGPTDADLRCQINRLTRRSFTLGGAAALLGLGAWQWLRTREFEDGLPWPFRRLLAFNEHLAEAYFRDARLAPTFAPTRAQEPRVNGSIGLANDFDPADWMLQVD